MYVLSTSILSILFPTGYKRTGVLFMSLILFIVVASAPCNINVSRLQFFNYVLQIYIVYKFVYISYSGFY